MDLRFIYIVILSILLSLFNLSPNMVYANNESNNESLEIQADSGVLMDMKTGQVLWSKNADKTHYPASITKILTAILALEHSKLDDSVPTSKLATEQEGNRVYLVEGEQVSLHNLLYGLLLQSGNDTAIAIAEHVAGSVPNFADMMNKKAVALGATHSHFVNPNGLHDPNHYTTARDMAIIARYAMQNETFREIVRTKYYPWQGKEWKSELVNLNKLLWSYNGATGIKTGFTDQAQQTIVASAKRGNQEFLVCLMQGQTQQSIRDDATKLLDYGFNHYTTRTIAQKGEVVYQLSYPGNVVANVLLADDFAYVFPRREDSSVITREIHVQKPNAPLTQGTQVGTMDFVQSGKKIGSVPLVVAKDVPKLFDYSDLLLFIIPLLILGIVWTRVRIRTARARSLEN